MKASRVGRPPASSAAETRQRILDVACDLFAMQGYGVTTIKDVAAKAGITTGALYYYFDSKLDMYLAVHEHLRRLMNERFDLVMASQDTFDGCIRGILESAYDINRDNPAVARFEGTANVDRVRHAELAEAIKAGPGDRSGIVRRLVAKGLETGEIEPGRQAEVAAVLRIVFVGLTDALSFDPTEQRIAIDGLQALLDARLIRPLRSLLTD